ncbi:MAG: MltA domain-containing protein [Candidatus Jidaibacter sp.]|jgi:membrane-bound lytic murein transglycosylase A|nr:MltA domain-containing protein [Candidatus Jidaibacter sp.]
MNRVYILCLMIISFVLVGCASKQERTARFKPVAFSQVDGWDHDTHLSALESFRHSCKRIMNMDLESKVSKATDLGGSAVDWQVPCMDAYMIDQANDKTAKQFFEKWFQPYQVYDENWHPEGMLTGYFQIELNGSKKKDNRYKYPVYRSPKGLASIKGSSDIEHASINGGALNNQGLEVAYVDNRARLYFMHIQGSGIIKLKEGGHLPVGFEDHNGFRFTGINEALKSKNLRFDSAEQMMNWLHNNPNEARKIMEEDPSYVFFRPLKDKDPIGGQGVPLRPERSLAVDYGLYPYGMPVWVATNLPEKSIFKGRDYKRLFIAQDTGGAIRGPIRGDVFFGRGLKAEKVASHFKAKTKFFTFFPKTVKVPEIYTSR